LPKAKLFIARWRAVAIAGLLPLLAGCPGGSGDPNGVFGKGVSSPQLTIQIGSGNGQTADAGTSPSQPLVVVVESSGSPVSGVPVEFSVITGGGTLTSSANVTTGPDGTASVTVLLGNVPGVNQFHASVVGAAVDLFINGIAPNSGPKLTSVGASTGPSSGGINLTLNGTGFLSGAIAYVGGNECATTLYVQPTELICVTPAGTGTVDVSVTNPDTQSSTLVNVYTYTSGPGLGQVTPTGGALAGGTTLTLTGGNFAVGATVTVGGNVCTGVTVVSVSQVTCTAPAHTAGTVNVSLANPDGQSTTLVNAYTYNPLPTLTGVSPSAGALAGGGTLTLTGTGFLSGAAITVGGTVCGSVSVLSGTSATCVLPAKSAGTYSVIFANADSQSVTLTNAYKYEPAPTITSVTPNIGPTAGGTSVTITGTGFINGLTVVLGGPACSIAFSSATQILCTTPSQSAGSVLLLVTNPDGQSASSTFNYLPAPTITSLSPANGAPAGGTAVTLYGTNFTCPPTSVTFGGAAASVITCSSGQIALTTPAGSIGAVNVVETNDDGETVTATHGFTYNPAPTITGFSPVGGPLGGGGTLTVTGTGFLTGATVSLGAGSCGSPSVSATQITCNIPAHTAGTVSVSVVNPDTQNATAAGTFNYNAGPALSSLNVGSGPATGGNNVTLTGSGFISGAVAWFGGTSCTSTTFVSATTLVCAAPAESPATVNVSVVNPDGQSSVLPNIYTFDAGPSLSTITPNNGPLGGAASVTLAGSGFVSGASVTIGGSPCTSLSVVSSSTITCKTPVHAVGTVDVVVANPDTQSSTLTNGYTYNPAPTLTSVSPSLVSSAGGATLTLIGTNFLPGAIGSIAGTNCAATIYNSPTQATCISPAVSPGLYRFVYTNSDGQSASLANAVQVDTPPVISSESPIGGVPAGGTSVTFQGTGFNASATVTFGGSPCTITSINSTQIICTAPSGTIGDVAVVVANPDGLTAGATYSYESAPAITSVAPSIGSTTNYTSVTVNGSGFFCNDGNPWVDVDGAAVSICYCSTTSLSSCGGSGLPPLSAGSHTLHVTNHDGAAASATVQYDVSPQVLSFSPPGGPGSGGTNVTIIGIGFEAGATVNIGSACSNITIVSSSEITCTTQSGNGGWSGVEVINPDGLTAIAPGQYFFNSGPNLSSVSPSVGSMAGGNLLTLNMNTCCNLAGAWANAVTVNGQACTSLTLVNGFTMTCIAPAGSGTANIVITDYDGQSTTALGAYTYQPWPTVSSISPAAGPPAGGTVITITGGNFSSPTVTVGGAACAVSASSSTSITCTTPPGGTGAANVVITNTSGNSYSNTVTGGFTYDGTPTVTGISPPNGSANGGTAVTITGTGFVNGATATLGGVGCTSLTVVSSTQITCTSPSHAAGAGNVIVTNPDTQTGTLSNGFTWVTPPTVSGVSPVGGPAAGGTAITVTGSAFQNGATISLGASGCNSVTFVSSTTLTCTTPSGSNGAVNVSVTNPGGLSGTLTGGFNYEAAPTVSTISPVVGEASGGNGITITGTGFLTGATVTLGGVAASSVSVVSSTTITAVTAAHTAQLVDVVVTNPDTQSGTLTNGFTYSSQATPSISSISPIGGNTAGGTALTITGSHFVSGATVKLGSASCTSVAVPNSSTITCTTPAQGTGPVTVTVTGTDGQTATYNSFLYAAAPVVLAINPTGGSLGGNTPVNITGTGFQSGATVTIGTASCTGVTTQSPWTSLNCVTSTNIGGIYNVTVTNPDNQFGTLSDGYTYRAAPTVTGIVPPAGSPSGSTAVTITGTGFLNGATVTIGSGCSSVSFVSSTQLTCTTVATAQGTYGVEVINPDNQTGTLSNGFVYTTAPLVTAISPTYGVPGGGTAVTITGGAFVNGATVTIGGVAATSVTWVSEEEITAVTGSHAVGTVDVVVTNPNTLTGTLSGGFHYTTAPAPVVSGVSPTTGSVSGGQTNTVSGSNFQNGATVTFGGLNCPATFVNSNTLTCVTPAEGVGTVDVTVTNPDTQVGTLASSYTYMNNPTVNVANPSMGPLAGGTSITVTGSGFLTGSNVWVGGVTCTSVVIVSGTSLTCTTGAHSAGAATITVTTPDGRTGSLSGGFTYNPAPTLFAVYPAYGSASGGNTLTLLGTGILSAATVTVGGTACASPSVSPPNKITCIAPSGSNGFATVAIQNPDGQSVNQGTLYHYGTPAAFSQIATVAGIPSSTGAADGSSTTARFDFAPGGSQVVQDGTGTYLYVSDTANFTIREVTIATGAVTTLAGLAGASACTDGTGSSARFGWPWGLFVQSGYLYIADQGCNAIRQLDIATGAVTTIAGGLGAANGFVNATGTSARFNTPNAILISGGVMYISDAGNYAIREMNMSTLAVTTLAGGNQGNANGTGTAAKFEWPASLATDGTNLFVTDMQGPTVRQIVISSAVVTTLAGKATVSGYVDATGTSAQFNHPSEIVYSGGYLYLADSNNNAIRQINVSTKAVTTYSGGSGGGYLDGIPASSPQFDFPDGLTTDGTNWYVTDDDNGAVRTIAISSGDVGTLVGTGSGTGSVAANGTGSAARFAAMGYLTGDGTNLYFPNANAISELSPTTGVVSTYSGVLNDGSGNSDDGGPGVTQYWNPTGISTDGNNFYITQNTCNSGWGGLLRQLQIATGDTATLFGDGQYGDCATTLNPEATTTDGQYIYLADGQNCVIRSVDISTGSQAIVAGQLGTCGSQDGTGSGAQFNVPSGIATDGTYLYVAAYFDCAIRRVDPASGAVVTIAGNLGNCNHYDGLTGSASYFNYLNSITTDGVSLYVTETNRYGYPTDGQGINLGAIRKVAIGTGQTTTLNSGYGVDPPGDVDGAIATATVFLPYYVYFQANQLFFGNGWNVRVLK
jgi:hypothetical protein